MKWFVFLNLVVSNFAYAGGVSVEEFTRILGVKQPFTLAACEAYLNGKNGQKDLEAAKTWLNSLGSYSLHPMRERKGQTFLIDGEPENLNDTIALIMKRADAAHEDEKKPLSPLELASLGILAGTKIGLVDMTMETSSDHQGNLYLRSYDGNKKIGEVKLEISTLVAGFPWAEFMADAPEDVKAQPSIRKYLNSVGSYMLTRLDGPVAYGYAFDRASVGKIDRTGLSIKIFTILPCSLQPTAHGQDVFPSACSPGLRNLRLGNLEITMGYYPQVIDPLHDPQP